MDSYATVAQLRIWLGLAPDAEVLNAVSKLRSATIRVAQACHLSPYDAGPSDNDQALQDATCAQAATWLALGIEPSAAGLDTAPVKKSTMLGDDVERDTRGQVLLFAAAAGELCQEAHDILYGAGLLWFGDFEIADAGDGRAEMEEIFTSGVPGWPFF